MTVAGRNALFVVLLADVEGNGGGVGHQVGGGTVGADTLELEGLLMIDQHLFIDCGELHTGLHVLAVATPPHSVGQE